MKRQHLFLLAMLLGGTAIAQPSGLQPFAELSAGNIRLNRTTLPTVGATLGVRSGDISLGLRYRHTLSPLHEATPVPTDDISLLLQHSIRMAPRLELYGGVATGFALEHCKLAEGNLFNGSKQLALSTEVEIKGN